MEKLKELIDRCLGRIRVLIKWIVFAGGTGALLGLVGAWFARSIAFVTALRGNYPWMLYLLPVAGLVIAALYQWGQEKGGTNLVLESIRTEKEIPFRMAPMIFISTVLTHMFGGSAGREGAALQLGGSFGAFFGRVLKIDEKDKKVVIMCGMSAAFSALFGTPLAATIFAMEVVTVGIIHYSALVPCSIAALVAHEIALYCGGEVEAFAVHNIPSFSAITGGKMIVLAFLCAGLSILFCIILHGSEKLYKKTFPNPYLRIVAGGVFVIVLAKVLGTTDYLGGGMNIVELAVEGKVVYTAFFLKIVFTALTLGAGYKGGEIVPTLFVGATFGCVIGQIMNLSPSLCAACGMVALFSGVTNSPITALVLAFEMFGFEGMPYYLLAVSIAYMESGYFGLYHSQKIMYSKIRPEFINEQTK